MLNYFGHFSQGSFIGTDGKILGEWRDDPMRNETVESETVGNSSGGVQRKSEKYGRNSDRENDGEKEMQNRRPEFSCKRLS